MWAQEERQTFPAKGENGELVAHRLYNHIICQYGPQKMGSDGGTSCNTVITKHALFRYANIPPLLATLKPMGKCNTLTRLNRQMWSLRYVWMGHKGLGLFID